MKHDYGEERGDRREDERRHIWRVTGPLIPYRYFLFALAAAIFWIMTRLHFGGL